MGFRSLGLGFESEKTPKWEWDWCFVSISVGSGHWLVGFGKNGGWEMGSVTPFQDPFHTFNCRMKTVQYLYVVTWQHFQEKHGKILQQHNKRNENEKWMSNGPNA